MIRSLIGFSQGVVDMPSTFRASDSMIAEAELFEANVTVARGTIIYHPESL
jgi:hypothetical protein